MILVISEKEWQGQVVELAQWLGYEHIYHTWNSVHSPAGFPDLIILDGKVMIVAELKREDGILSPEQYFWLVAFLEVTPAVYLWKPSDFESVIKVLMANRKIESKVVEA